jgi:hypothetical protein
MKDKAFLTLTGLFFVVLFAGIAVISLEKPTSNILRASNKNPSPQRSLIVVFPQVGTIGDDTSEKKPSKIKVVVTIRDIDGSILSNRTIKLSSSMPNVKITPADTQTTDIETNQATFYLSSAEAGTAKLKITDVASNLDLINVPTVEFTE